MAQLCAWLLQLSYGHSSTATDTNRHCLALQLEDLFSHTWALTASGLTPTCTQSHTHIYVHVHMSRPRDGIELSLTDYY